MSDTPLLELKNISYAYPGRKPVLHNLDFSLAEGDRIGLIGGNGTGKTTLAHIVMGLITPDSGEILLHGVPVKDEKGFRDVRRAIGLLFQQADDQLFYPTVLEDVAFGPLNLGYNPLEAVEMARATLAALGLEGFEDRLTHKLSGGEKKLVSLATVLAMKPAALFLDEPTNALDMDTRARIIDILNNLELTCVIISHDWDFLAHTTRDIYAVKDGHIHFDGRTHAHEHIHAHTHGSIPHSHE